MTDLDEKIKAYWDRPEQKDLLVELVRRLVEIPSVREDAVPNAPFGPQPARCLAEALDICRELGFATENVDNYVGVATLNESPVALHILGHLDVVGEGKGWTRPPYQLTQEEGILYGRGVIDDKGPVVAAMLAMKCVKDLGIKLPDGVQLLLGTDEESGSEDIAYYYKKHPYAKYAFTPDASFPLINVEKGSYKPTFTAKLTEPPREGVRVTALEGGFRINVIPGEAEAMVEGMTAPEVGAVLTRTAEKTGVRFSARSEGTGCRICAKGVGGHASTPEAANNALTALLSLLDQLPLVSCPTTAMIRALAERFPHGSHNGQELGMAVSDPVAGGTTVALTLLTMNEAEVYGRFDSRTSLAADEENTRKPVEKSLAMAGFKVTGGMEPPHHTPEDAPIVKALLSCYQHCTGRTDCRPLAIGGGTYVHDIPGGVAFGCEMDDFEYNMHGPDERVPVDSLLLSGRIFTHAIIALCGES